MEELCPTEETYSGEWEQRIVDDLVGQRQQQEENSDDDEDVNDVSEMSISMPTTLTYDKINSYLQEIKEFAIQKQPKYLSTVMQFIDLNDACTIEYKSQKQQTTIDKFFSKASQ